ncbi:retrovirus-related Pol polyprotein from transposon TNT 1-94 [Trichonephila clavipes]|nr:retrovirus-related Pol polyprotein from transposon TNT 1-94 [Trichonephila clavipes]
MDNFLTELGIKHEVTNSYTPEMNGVAERFNLTALDGIKTLLKSSEVPHKFWGEALLCFTYAWNRICHKDSNKTPFEKYSGRKPSVLHLKPFGCLAYAGVPKQIRKKFDMRAKMGIMMGYAQRTKGYRIWLIDENKLVETINVRFDENKRGINFRQKVNSNLGYNLNLPDYYDDEDDFDRVKDSLTSRLVSKTSTETPSTSEKPDVSSDNHSLIPCTEVKWIRNIGRKVTGSNVYYSIEGEATRLKSFNEIERYCKRHNIKYDPSLFNFRKDNTESQGFSDLSEQQEALMVEVTIPNCYKQAIRSRDASKWHDAMDKEINVMKERKVWDLVDHPDNIKILENRWVYTIKYDENNKIVRYKARLVARGNTQLRGESFDEVFQEYKLELSKVKSLKLRCYSDSDFATNRDDRVSMGGFITFIDETPISSRTFKQKSVSLSTMEAEYVSLTEAAKEFIWLKNVIDNKSLNLELSENVMFCDNQAAISFSKSPVENYRTKHIDVRYHFLRNLIYDKTKPEQPDEEATYKEKLDLQLRKDRCYTLIYTNISSDLKNLITETTDGVAAWKILKDHFEPVTRARVIQLLDQFFGTKYQPGEDVGIFISRVKTAATRLQEAGHKLDDLYIGFQLIRWLPQEFQSTVQQIYRWKEEDFRVVKIEAELILEANRLQLMKQDLEKAENAYLSSFTSKKSKTLPGATAAAHGDPNGKNDYQKKSGKPDHYIIPKSKEISFFSDVTAKTKNGSIEIWHQRFCHVNNDYLVKTSKNDSVKGLPRLTDNGKTHCIPCKLAKSKRVSFKKMGAVRSKRPLELLHMDLCGPMPTESQGGNKYFLSIIDDYSRKVTVFPIRNKSDVFHTFIRFQKRAERFLSKKVIAVRTDGGLEFCNKDMDNFLTELGIKHEVTNSYTPEMNGVAERFNLTALDGIKTLLKSSEVPHKFWGEALLCFTYAWNRICHKDSNKTPFEKYSGRKPSVLHLKPFGCLAYAGVPKQIRKKKFDMRAKMGIMMEYAQRTKGYRIWLIDENKLVETINVRFDENKRGINFRQKVNSNLGYNLNLPDYYDDEDDFDRVKDSLTSRLVSKTSTETPSTSEKPDVSSDNHSLIPCTEVKWIRNIGRKVTGSNVYYSIEGEATRLKSFNEIERYCKRHNIKYDPSLFNFRKDNTESQGFSDLSEQQEALMVEVTIPNCYKQAIRSRDASKWHDAMDKEINVMKERKVWDLVDHPDNIKILENRWVYTIKYDENNKIVRYKARLVARGNTQLRGESFDEVFQEYKLELSKVKSLKLRCYSDSDFATNRDDRVSMGGFITFIDETPISSRTFKQKSVSLSTMEAEYVSLTEAAKEFIWLKNVIDNKSLNLELSENVMFCDNQAAISFSKSPVENYRTKHIDVRYHFLRNLIYDKVFQIKYIGTKNNLADIFTKPMVKEKLLEFCRKLFLFRE